MYPYRASPAKTAQPGDTVTYTHILTNNGNGTDTFNLRAVSSHGWIVSVSPNPSVAAGETATINVTITIPNDAHNSIVDEVTLTVDSQFDPNATAFVTDTTTIVETPVTDPGEIIYLPLIEM